MKGRLTSAPRLDLSPNTLSPSFEGPDNVDLLPVVNHARHPSPGYENRISNLDQIPKCSAAAATPPRPDLLRRYTWIGGGSAAKTRGENDCPGPQFSL